MSDERNYEMSSDAKPQPVVPAYYLGVDGGGSKTLAVIVDAEGHEIGRGQSGSSNYAAIGLTASASSIYAAVQGAATSAGIILPVQHAWLGIAGIDRPEDQAALHPHVASLATLVHVTNDANLAFSVLPDAAGVALIAGTGSIALGRDHQGRQIRAGGWGHFLGDEGSGYDLGRRALLAAVRAADKRAPHTELLPLILRYWELRQPEDLLGAIYGHEDKARIARLSACVFTAARAGDAVASQIVEQGAAELALAVNAVYQQLGFAGQPLPLALCGGLLLHEQDYREQMLHTLSTYLSLGPVVDVVEPALSAARASITYDQMTVDYSA